MKTELVLLEVSEKNYPKIYCAGGLNAFYEKSKAEVDGEVADLSTRKGRDRIATLAADVSRSKVAVETPGRAYNKFLKAQPKLIDKELREFCDKMDKLRDDTREPLTAWEVIDKAEKAQVIDTKSFLIEYELQHEDGLRDNELIDLKAAQAEADRKAEIKAAEIKAAAEATAKTELEAAAKIKQAELDTAAAKQAAKDAEWLTYIGEAYEINTKIDSDKQAAIVAEDARKREEMAQWIEYISEAYAYNDQLIAAENARQTELNRQNELADQQKRQQQQREIDKRHCGNINRTAMEAFIHAGLSQEQAKIAVTAIAKKLIPAVTISY